MRFNSYEFIFIFFPTVWLGWRGALWLNRWQAGVAWLCLASLVFYGYWSWKYVPLLVVSLIVNYLLGQRLGAATPRSRRFLLGFGLCWNIGLLGYFKYFNFFLTNLNTVAGTHWTVGSIVLPLGISFFTFQKIAYLIDASRGQVRETKFLDFALFVLFFPQLIAGPIVHHGEFIPQLRDRLPLRFDPRKTLLGGALFAFGLFQKVVIADTLAPMADSTFGLAANEVHLKLVEAWAGVFAYSIQLLYDFSGYSHMALGLALMLGFKLPVNFLAPYSAGSIIEFWRRWHITLSSFLRDYVYIPLGGSRHGFRRQMGSLFVTMAIAGLWHGAGWTFILWGAGHGAALCLNHLWRRSHPVSASPNTAELRPTPWWGRPLTWFVVAVGWAVFRSSDLTAARLLGESLLGLHGISVPITWAPWVESFAPVVRPRGLFPNIEAAPSTLLLLFLAGWTAILGPRLLAWMGVTLDDVTSIPRGLAGELAPSSSRISYLHILLVSVLFALAIAGLSRSSPFLYFQF